MSVEFPIARSAALAVTSPLGFAAKEIYARRRVIQLYTDGEKDPDTRDRIAARIAIVTKSAFAPGFYRTEAGARRNWQERLDQHWAELIHLTDGRIRIGITYFQLTDNGKGPPNAIERELIRQRTASPIRPPNGARQLPMNIGLFDFENGAGLRPALEHPDPVNARVLIPDD